MSCFLNDTETSEYEENEWVGRDLYAELQLSMPKNLPANIITVILMMILESYPFNNERGQPQQVNFKTTHSHCKTRTRRLKSFIPDGTLWR